MTKVGVKRMLSRLPDLVMDLTVDHKRRVVRMAMLELDSALLAHYVVDILPRDHGVVAAEEDIDIDEASLPRRPAYRLELELAGREYPGRVVRIHDGAVTVALGDPDAGYLARCGSAIEQLLSTLSSRGIKAVVAGVDRHGRPETDEGYVHLFLSQEDFAREDEVCHFCKTIGLQNRVDILVLRFSIRHGDAERVIAHEPHFSWDEVERQVVLRNWNPL